jgi:hypothetical protein
MPLKRQLRWVPILATIGWKGSAARKKSSKRPKRGYARRRSYGMRQSRTFLLSASIEED